MTDSLQTVQNDFQAFLTQKGTTVADLIQPMAKAESDAGLQAYAFAYWARLVEVLADDYKALDGLLGGDAFVEMGKAYLAAHPSTHFSATYFGQHLSEFLKTQPQYPAYYSELARFEWALSMAVIAADAPVVAFEEVAAIPPENWADLRATTHPSLTLLFFHYKAIPDLQRAVREDAPLPEMVASEDLDVCVIWRKDRQVYSSMLDKQEFVILDAFREGQSFAEVCACIAQWESDEGQVAMRAAVELRRWIDQGVISKLC